MKLTEEQIEAQSRCARASASAFDTIRAARSQIFEVAQEMSGYLDTIQDPDERKVWAEVRARWVKAYQTLTQTLTTLNEEP